MQMVLSPIGLIVTAFALAGGAIFLLQKKSEAFRETFGSVGRFVVTSAKRVWTAIKDAVGTVVEAFTPVKEAVVGTADALERRMKPAVNIFKDVGTAIRKGIAWVAQFVIDTLIPKLTSAVIFIGQHAMPAIRTAISAVGDAVGWVYDKVVGFFTMIRPYIDPAIKGFHSLANSIGAMFSGDFSKIGGGLKDAASGIGGAVSNIVGAIGSALAPVAKTVYEWFKGLFTADKIKGYISGVLAFVEGIGFVLGKIVTHPTTIKAIAGIAAAAVVIGFRLVKGIIRGIIDNLPGLWSMVSSAMGAGFKAIMANIGTIAMVALFAAFAIPKLVSGFKKIGAVSAEGFANGFKGSVKAGGMASVDFFRGMAGKAGQEGARAQKAFRRELEGINRQRMVIGAPQIGFGAQKLDTAKLAAARAELEKLQSQYSRAQLAGMAFMQNMQNTATNVGNAFKGVGKIFAGLGKVLKTGVLASKEVAVAGSLTGVKFSRAVSDGLWLGGNSIRKGFTQIMDSVKAQAKQTGSSVGAVVGTAVGSTLLASLGGFMTGKAAGEGGASFGALALNSAMTGLTAGLATGNPIVGVAAAGFSLLGGAIGQAGAEAKKFKEQVGKIGDSLRSEIKGAVEEGSISLDKLKKGLVDLSDVASSDSLRNSFRDSLGKDGVQALADFGISWDKDIVPIIKQGGAGSLDALRTKLLDTFASTTTGSKKFRDAFGTIPNGIEDVTAAITDLIAVGGGQSYSDLYNALIPNETDTKFQPMRDALRQNQALIEGIINTSGQADTAVRATHEALKGFNADARVFGSQLAGTETATAKALLEIQNAKFEDSVKAIKTAYDEAAIARDNFFNPSATNTLQTAVDNAIVSVEGIGIRMQENLDFGTVAGGAAARLGLAGLQKQISDVIGVGIQQGMVHTPADAFKLTADLYQAAVAGLPKDSAAFKQITEAYGKAISEAQPVISKENTTRLAQQAVDEIQAYADLHGIEVPVKAQWARQNAVSMERNPEAFGRNGAYEIQVKINPPQPMEVRQNYQNYLSVGKDSDQGFADGMKQWSWITSAAARKVAQDAVNAARGELQSSSPSKVFIKIGKDVSKGLAIGITSETDNVTAAATSVVDAAVQSALDSVNRGKKILQAAYAELFKLSTGANINNPQAGGMTVTNAIAGVTNATQSFYGTVTSNGQAIFDATKIPAKDRTPQQQNLVGENPYSLSPADVTGAANLAAVQQALQAIIDLGTSLLAGGTPISTVVARMTNEVKTFVDNAVKMGFSRKSLNKIVDSMGLSKADLAKFASTAAGIKGPPNQGNNPPPSDPGSSVPTQTTLPPINTASPAQAARMAPTMAPNATRSLAANETRSAPVQHITVNLTLPYGDPAAVALAVSNRIATRV
jgi:hypothetical protein